MPKTKISEFSATPANNTDIDSINIAEGCAPSGINDAIRELMAQLKDFQTGAVGDSFNGPINGTVGATTPAAGAFTTLAASSTVSGTGFSTYLASPPAIGGTAAAAGAFTTLAASGAVTLSGGTANGVTYLNGSKVVTSGSALQFDGTSLFVGATSGLGKLVVKDTASSNTLWLVGRTSDGASSVSFRNAADSAYSGRIEVDATSGMQFGLVGAAEGMRLTSTGLGIGTSSPAFKLQVTTVSGNWGIVHTAGTASVGTYADSTGGGWLGTYSNHKLNFFTNNGSSQMVLDTSGNLGLGVTPSAWNTSNKAFQFSSSGVLFGETGNTYLGSNVFVNSGGDNRYITTNFASMYRQVDGKHLWYTAASGTAGNSITFTNPMSLLATGEFLIGTTSAGASQRLAIVGGATLCMMKNTDATDGTARTTILFRDNGDNNRGSITVSTSGTVYNTTSDYRLKEDIAPMTGALAKVAQLNPVTYKWKETGDSGQGFIAHELAQVVPECVTGEKDAVEQRNGQEFIVPQGIDTSFLVATLTAALQELNTKFDAYVASHP